MELYRPGTTRANWTNYTVGRFFVTICTHEKRHHFGTITNGEMHLSEIGKFLDEQIKCTTSLRDGKNVQIPIYTIMPNHVHMIVCIGHNNVATSNNNAFKPQTNNLASIVRGIKSSVTSYCKNNNIDFAWQPRYYDIIIQTDIEYHDIAKYIGNNVLNWSLGKGEDF